MILLKPKADPASPCSLVLQSSRVQLGPQRPSSVPLRLSVPDTYSPYLGSSHPGLLAAPQPPFTPRMLQTRLELPPHQGWYFSPCHLTQNPVSISLPQRGLSRPSYLRQLTHLSCPAPYFPLIFSVAHTMP